MNIDSIVVIVSYIGNAILLMLGGIAKLNLMSKSCPKLWKFNTGEFSKRQKLNPKFILNLIEI